MTFINVSPATPQSVLAAHPLFQGLPAEVLQAMCLQADLHSFHAGEVVFHEGDAARHWFLVVQGHVEVVRFGCDGDERVFHRFGPGQCVAEAAMFMEGVYPVHAEAITAARLLRIEGRSMHQRIRTDPSLAFAMLGAMSLRLRALVNEIEQLKRRSATERVAEFLLSLSPADDVDRSTVNLPFEKLVIAARLGIKPESFSRALVRLKTLGVSVDGSRLSIASRQALLNFLKTDSTIAQLPSPDDPS